MKRIYIILGVFVITIVGILCYDKLFREKIILDTEDKMFTLTIDGVEVDEIPTTGSYTGKYNLTSYTCEQGSTISWDSSTRQISTTMTAANESCTLNFEEIKFTDQAISYSGSPVAVTLYPGTYLLQVWGASGGNAYSGDTGGKGGYSVGKYTVTSNTTVYVVVGGQGSYGASSTFTSGGYNGGGASGYNRGGSGGGATHIATKTGVLSSLSSSTSNVLIVAGGGGGGANDSNNTANGGVGGGTSGANGTGYSSTYNAGGGTQSSGGSGTGYSSTTKGVTGSFGQGGSASTKSSSYNISGGGGGGWYGGGGGGYRDSGTYYRRGASGGGGGSGYISSALTNASTTAGNNLIPSTSGSGTETGHSGNGYAKITLCLNSSCT